MMKRIRKCGRWMFRRKNPSSSVLVGSHLGKLMGKEKLRLISGFPGRVFGIGGLPGSLLEQGGQEHLPGFRHIRLQIPAPASPYFFVISGKHGQIAFSFPACEREINFLIGCCHR